MDLRSKVEVADGGGGRRRDLRWLQWQGSDGEVALIGVVDCRRCGGG